MRVRHIFLIIFFCLSSYSARPFLDPIKHAYTPAPKQDIADGEAEVIYLNHSGWAVKTSGHFLIFDYWQGRGSGGTERSLKNGYIDPAEISDENVIVFVSHSHGDHYDRIIHEWEGKIGNIEYVFGWRATRGPDHHCITGERQSLKVGDAQIDVVNHRIDGVPEVAFLVRVDGITAYHSGDHGFYKGSQTELYESNIDYLAGLTDKVDLAFIMAVDGGGRITKYTPTIIEGAFYTAEKLNVQVLFPMHGGGFEHYYGEFFELAKTKNINYTVFPASKRGDIFHYKGS